MIKTVFFEHFEERYADLLTDGWEECLKNVLDKANSKLSELEKLPSGDQIIEVNFMSDEQIKDVNAVLRAIEKPTDVISLKLGEGAPIPTLPDGAPGEVFGEIYISIEKCAEQAVDLHQSFLEELAFLFVHGILHIFDYDHTTPEEEDEMMSVAYEILGRGQI